jgi:hypothetical protein
MKPKRTRELASAARADPKAVVAPARIRVLVK